MFLRHLFWQGLCQFSFFFVVGVHVQGCAVFCFYLYPWTCSI